MFKTMKVKRGDKLTTVTLSTDVYELLSLKLGKLPDSLDSLPLVRDWAQSIIKQHDNPKYPNFSQWLTGQAVRFLADTETQAAYQDWVVSDAESAPQDTGNNKERAIKRANELRGAGMSWDKIADQLGDEGIPTITGKGQWRGSNLASLCRKAI